MTKRVVATGFILICTSWVAILGGTPFTMASRTGKPVHHYVFFAFWCTEEPYYSSELITFLRER